MEGFEFQRGGGTWHGDVTIGNISYERVEQFNYLETTFINKIYIQVETKNRLKECILSFGAEFFVLQFAV